MKTKTMLLACFTFVSGLALAQVPTTGLLSSWEFNNNLLDGTATGNNGTWMGLASTLTYVNDRCGNPQSALQFNGVSDYVKMLMPGPSGANARSLSFWMRSNNHNAGDQYVVRGIFNYGKYTQANTGSRWEICHNYGCEGVGVDISHEYFTSPSACVNDGRWHHIVVTHAASAQLNQARIYIDGILMPQPSVEPVYLPPGNPNCSPTSNIGPNATDIGPLAPNLRVVTIGCVIGSLMPNLPPVLPGRFYKGELDDFYFYDRVLTPVEVAQLFAEKCELRPCITCHNSTDTINTPPKDTIVPPPIDTIRPKRPANLEQGGGEIKGASTTINLSDKNVVILNQNVPNPFAESTEITYSIPRDFTRAQILFFNDKGLVIKSLDIKQKGAGSVTVFADDLSDGIYAYNLVIDGVTVESKKMIKEQ